MPGSHEREAEIRKCCAEIVASNSFAPSPRLCRFLEYIVELSLAGKCKDIKEYAIGVDVFDRVQDFDPKCDAIVRVQARRLRDKLHEYYAGQTEPAQVRIEVPKGSYVPIFHFAEPLPEPAAEAAPLAADTSEPVVRSATPAALEKPPFSRRILRPLLITVVSLTSLTALLTIKQSEGRGKDTSAHRQLMRLTHDHALMPALSPDGKWIAYSSDRASEGNMDIWIQRLPRTDPVRLTSLPHQEWTPSFSPDGSAVWFWYSAIHAGLPEEGLYSVPIIGGEPRRLVAGMAGNPRVSADGNWIAFTGGTARRYVLSVVSAHGGTPVELTPQFETAGFPAWLPDDKHLIFLGTVRGQEDLLARTDWWVIPSGGGTPVRTGAIGELLKEGVIQSGKATGDFWPSAWFGGRIIFRAGQGHDSQHIYSIPLNLNTFQAKGEIRQETFGGAREVLPAVSDEGTLAFCSQLNSREFWTLPLQANTGKLATSGLQQVTRNTASDGIGIFARDTKSMVFNSVRNNGNADIYRIDFDGSSEKAVAASSAAESLLGMNADGSRLLYAVRQDGKSVVYASVLAQHILLKICQECSAVITPDGTRVFYSESSAADPKSVHVVNLASSKHQFAFQVERDICFPCPSARFSWDGRWVAALRKENEGMRIALFPLPTLQPLRSEETVTIGSVDDGASRWAVAGSMMDWSPDGKIVYFASDRDGHRCIWAQRVEGAGKQPVGEAFAVYHNHQRSAISLSTMMVLRDRLCLGLMNLDSHIWLTKLR